MKTPPITRSSAPPPRAMAQVRPDAGVRDDGVIFFSVEGAPPEICRTKTEPDGSLTFHTTVAGRVLSVEPGEILIAREPHRIKVRHLLPASIDLSDLVGHAVRVEVSQRYLDAGRATIDAVIRDANDRLILWARDGRLPTDRDSHGLALRTLAEDAQLWLAVGHDAGVSKLAAPARAAVRREGESSTILVSRLGPDDVSMVLLRR